MPVSPTSPVLHASTASARPAKWRLEKKEADDEDNEQVKSFLTKAKKKYQPKFQRKKKGRKINDINV